MAQEGPWSPGISPEMESITLALTPSPSSSPSLSSESAAEVLQFRNGGFSSSAAPQDVQWTTEVNRVACFYVTGVTAGGNRPR